MEAVGPVDDLGCSVVLVKPGLKPSFKTTTIRLKTTTVLFEEKAMAPTLIFEISAIAI